VKIKINSIKKIIQNKTNNNKKNMNMNQILQIKKLNKDEVGKKIQFYKSFQIK
jgi:hypothetical protein